jgi:hypothetical protein
MRHLIESIQTCRSFCVTLRESIQTCGSFASLLLNSSNPKGNLHYQTEIIHSDRSFMSPSLKDPIIKDVSPESDSLTRILISGFIHESSSLDPLIVLIAPFFYFFKNLRRQRNSWFTRTTNQKWEKDINKSFSYFRHYWAV